nr:uncharacterized protein LOC126518586 [Dermacentor andersoni]
MAGERVPRLPRNSLQCLKRSGIKFLSAETYEAILLTSKSTVLCIKYLLESGFFYVLTKNLSSDPVELLFSSLRQMAGGNDCLDARAVTFSLERILRTGSLCPSQASNIENGQTVLSRHGASLNVTSSELDVPAEATAQETTHDSTETAQVAPARFTGTEDIVMHIDELFTSLKATPLQRPPSTIAYITGFVARAVEEWRTHRFCPPVHQWDRPSPVLMGLIDLQSRGGLTFPKSEFVTVLVSVKKAVDIALPHIKKSNVRQQLAELLLPRLEQCPLFVCPARDDHAASILSVVFDKFMRPLLANVGATVTDRAAYREKLA